MKGNENRAGTGGERRLRSGDTLQSSDTKKLNERLHNTDRRRYKSRPTGVAADTPLTKQSAQFVVVDCFSLPFDCLSQEDFPLEQARNRKLPVVDMPIGVEP